MRVDAPPPPLITTTPGTESVTDAWSRTPPASGPAHLRVGWRDSAYPAAKAALICRRVGGRDGVGRGGVGCAIRPQIHLSLEKHDRPISDGTVKELQRRRISKAAVPRGPPPPHPICTGTPSALRWSPESLKRRGCVWLAETPPVLALATK